MCPPRVKGLSPRVRGKPLMDRHDLTSIGSIPACAGETGNNDTLFPIHAVYPRVCGGNGLLAAI